MLALEFMSGGDFVHIKTYYRVSLSVVIFLQLNLQVV